MRLKVQSEAPRARLSASSGCRWRGPRTPTLQECVSGQGCGHGKVQGLLSVGATVWKVVTGELGFAEIAKMAWGAIQAMIPPTLVRILVEKLVAMIVPAVGALMVIVEGIQAAWGTVSQIIQALETFIAFLKAVKGGGAGPKFAAALAQAQIVVLDFVANYLLLKLGKGLKALAGKLKGIARRLMKKKRAGRRSRWA